MSNSEDSLHDTEDEAFIANFFPDDYKTPDKQNCHMRFVLKSKENILKQKATSKKILKKKLKKYKLRKDAQDDPAVIDISQSLFSLLRIQSRYYLNNNNYETNENIDEWTVNYLTKMAKKTQKCPRSNAQNVTTVVDEDKNESSKYPLIKINSEGENKKKQIGNENYDKVDKKIKTDFYKYDDSGSIQNCSEDNKVVSDSTQMNAFMIMMGARNKSIGSNSPGKEKDEEVIQDDKVMKSLKLKRTLALEKMALAKGSKKNAENEEIRNEIIKTKMEERAKKLKEMIANNKKQSNQCSKNLPRTNKTNHDTKKRCNKSYDCVPNEAKRFKSNVDDSVKDVVIVDSDESNDASHVSSKNMQDHDNTRVDGKRSVKSSGDSVLSRSDVEFIKKLSPSIKKKESMLSYYNKIERNKDEEDALPTSEKVIKVKFTQRKKLKLHKKKLSDNISGSCANAGELMEEEGLVDIHDHPTNKGKEEKNSLKDKREKLVDHSERKSKVEDGENEYCRASISNINQSNLTSKSVKITESDVSITDIIDKSSANIERRSKRLTRKPIKYQDIVDSSSDDDKVIITETIKKNKKTPSSNLKLKKIPTLSRQDAQEENPEKSKNIKSNKCKSSTPTKLAPIFSPKSQISKADLEAKQKFLQSGIPEQLKKIIEKQKNLQVESDYFNSVCHVQQKIHNLDLFNPWNLKPVDLCLLDENSDLTNNVNEKKTHESLHLKFETFPEKSDDTVIKRIDKERLHEMKISYPKFPVYKIFKTLKNKQRQQETQSYSDCNTEPVYSNHDIMNNLVETNFDDPKTTIWCEKFRPISTSDIIGNFDAINTLKEWLTNWKESNLNHRKVHTRSDSSDSSDFYYPSDSDSRDSQKSYNNVLVVTGPSGSGKTSAIYAVAAELFIKVIEVNTSAKRTGKVILSNLHEATQSHKVNRETTSTENSQNSQEVTRRRKPKKVENLTNYSKLHKHKQKTIENSAEGQDSQGNKVDNNRTAMSLILVEDADIVFEQDDGFISALNQIVLTSKRPVIMITSSLNCPHLQRFITNANVVKFHQLSPKMLGMWLDLMCLVEKGDIGNNVGQSLLEFYRGDIRKTINILQFWVGSSNSNLTDPNSETSLPNTDSQDKQGNDDECSSISWSDQDVLQTSKEVLLNQDITKINNSLFKTFITVHDHDIGIKSSVLQFPVNYLNIWWNVPKMFSLQDDNSENINSDRNRIKSLAKLIDSISISDVISAKMTPELDISVVSSDWQDKISDGANESVNIASYNRSVGLGDSMTFALLTSSINATRRAFKLEEEKLSVDYTVPGLTQLRSKEKLANRHNALYSSVPLTYHLDRRAIFMDYFSTCRDICRIEKDKSGNNTKRNNRFCHYMRSMKVDCAAETLDLLCDSLV